MLPIWMVPLFAFALDTVEHSVVYVQSERSCLAMSFAQLRLVKLKIEKIVVAAVAAALKANLAKASFAHSPMLTTQFVAVKKDADRSAPPPALLKQDSWHSPE